MERVCKGTDIFGIAAHLLPFMAAHPLITDDTGTQEKESFNWN